jgi:uncharacterized protein YpiB (UPF0302 family)
MADHHELRMKLDVNLLQINAALDHNERRRFALLCKRRHDLKAKLSRTNQPLEV